MTVRSCRISKINTGAPYAASSVKVMVQARSATRSGDSTMKSTLTGVAAILAFFGIVSLAWADMVTVTYTGTVLGGFDQLYQIPMIRTRGPIGAVRWT